MIRLLSAICLSICLGAAQAADDLAKAARGIAERDGRAVVAVRVVVKVKVAMAGQTQDEEQKIETIGTVIDPSGLTVISSGAIDPAQALTGLLAKSQPMMGMPEPPKAESDLKEIAIILADGTELDAEVAIKDVDLGLALVRPRTAPAKPLAAVALAARSGVAGLYEALIIPGRLGKDHNRAASLTVGRVMSYVKGPQPYYLADRDGPSVVGSLAFTSDGAVLGVFVTRITPPGDKSGGMMSMVLSLFKNAHQLDGQPVLRPVDAVIELAAQIPKP